MLGAGCGSSEGARSVSTGDPSDDALAGNGEEGVDPGGVRKCDQIEFDGDFVVEHERDFTARFRAGEPYTKTVMLFGGEPLGQDNVFGSGYIIGLDQVDAMMLAERYPDFYLCSSPGGREAANYIVPYDLVPASCEVYDEIIGALRQYEMNVLSGGDRTSLRFEGAPLQLESVIADESGDDYTAEALEENQDFHLVTAVEQLTGQSVLSFGSGN